MEKCLQKFEFLLYIKVPGMIKDLYSRSYLLCYILFEWPKENKVPRAGPINSTLTATIENHLRSATFEAGKLFQRVCAKSENEMERIRRVMDAIRRNTEGELRDEVVKNGSEHTFHFQLFPALSRSLEKCLIPSANFIQKSISNEIICS